VGVRQEPTSGVNPTSSSVHLSQVRVRRYSWISVPTQWLHVPSEESNVASPDDGVVPPYRRPRFVWFR
jgi:hypothetical protein